MGVRYWFKGRVTLFSTQLTRVKQRALRQDPPPTHGPGVTAVSIDLPHADGSVSAAAEQDPAIGGQT